MNTFKDRDYCHVAVITVVCVGMIGNYVAKPDFSAQLKQTGVAFALPVEKLHVWWLVSRMPAKKANMLQCVLLWG